MAGTDDRQADVAGPFDRSILEWLLAAVGTAVPAYLLNCDEFTIEAAISGTAELSNSQIEVIENLGRLRQTLLSSLDDAASQQAIRLWLAQLLPDGRTMARMMRAYLAGPELPPATKDTLESALALLAMDAFAGYLYSPDPDFPNLLPFEKPSFVVSQLIFRHPQSEAFSQTALEDSVLGRVFATAAEGVGHVAMLRRNTGRGGSMQLSMLPELLLNKAWYSSAMRPDSPASFAALAISELRKVRDVLAGGEAAVKARVAFAGVLLPAGLEIKLRGGALVRAVTPQDRRFVPEAIKGQLTTTDLAGNSTVINYDGDVLLECSFSYKVQVLAGADDFREPWPEDMRPPVAVEQWVTRLRMALTLAVERDPRVQIVPTWRDFEEPLELGHSMSWSDARQTPGLMPTQLTDSEVAAWAQWYKRLSSPHVGKVEIALSRILRALAERREPSDVLIDSVIAWENIFGSKQGEPTLRVTVAIAKLLESSLSAREELRSKLNKIYTLRSNIVHGSAPLKAESQALCHEALNVAIKALRILTTDRQDVLALPDGGARSNKLILE